MEIVGRWWLIGPGIILSAISVSLITTPSNILWLYFIRFACNAGTIPTVASPLVADYTQEKSRGLATGYGFTASVSGIVLATLILPWVPESQWFLWSMSILFLVIGISLIFLIAEVKEWGTERVGLRDTLRRIVWSSHIPICYVTLLISRIHILVSTGFFTAWVSSKFEDN